MYFITLETWDKIPNDYKTEQSEEGGRTVFEGSINPNGQGGTNLLFEHKHFEIIDSGNPEKDAITCEILKSLAELSPEDREKARRLCLTQYTGSPVEDFVNAAVDLVS